MKNKAILVVLLTTLYTIVMGQQVEIPDVIFYNKLIAEGVDANGDMIISISEALDVDSLDISPREINEIHEFTDTIKSLVGIEHFENLRFLNCSNNRIASCDLSNNSKLQVLEIISNNLRFLDIGSTELAILFASHNQLSSISLTDQVELTKLDLSQNEYLSEVDLTNMQMLTDLNLSYTKIDVLDISPDNQITTLTFKGYEFPSIELSLLNELRKLDMEFSSIEILDVRALQNLQTLEMDWSALKKFTAANESLEFLAINHANLEAIDLTNSPNLIEVNVVNNALQSLQVQNLKQLKTLNCGLNELSEINLNGCKSLFHLSANDSKLTKLEFQDNVALEYIYINNNNFSIFPELITLKKLNSLEIMSNKFSEALVQNSSLKFINLGRNENLQLVDICEAESIDNLQLFELPQEVRVYVPSIPFPPEDMSILLGDDNSPNLVFSQCTTSINNQLAQNISVFPIPFDQVINIEHDNITSPQSILLYNQLGQIVRQSDIETETTRMEVSELPNGIYYLELYGQAERVMIKLIKG